MLQRTYEVDPSVPAAMTWETYSTRVASEWAHLVASPEATKERAIQTFMEQHPCLVPGSHDSIDGAGSGHWPFPGAVITQPPLHGITKRVPDFMWIASDSAKLCPILVEIERPDKKWFRASDGVPDADFTQALNQLTEWKSWFNRPTNQQLFKEFYAIPDDLWRSRTFRPKYVLIYGSRAEFVDDDELNRKRTQQERPDETHMTFDRVYAEPKARDLLTVSIRQAGEYQAVSWPAATRLSPSSAAIRARIRGKEAAIAQSPWLSADRRARLLDRVAYWDQWSRSSARGIIEGGVFE